MTRTRTRTTAPLAILATLRRIVIRKAKLAVSEAPATAAAITAAAPPPPPAAPSLAPAPSDEGGASASQKKRSATARAARVCEFMLTSGLLVPTLHYPKN